MSSTDPEVIAAVDEIVEKRFALEVERDAVNRRFQAAIAEITKFHDEALRELTLLERQLDPAILASNRQQSRHAYRARQAVVHHDEG